MSSIVSSHTKPLRTRVFQGAAQIPVLGIVGLLINPTEQRPTPLVFGSLILLCAAAGAAGGAAYYASDAWRARGGWRKVLAYGCIALAYTTAAGGFLFLYAVAAKRFVHRGA